MIARLCMSDLHLGDARSTLSIPEVAAEVVREIVDLSGGAITRLILNGDSHEECVPAGIGDLVDGVARSVLEASANFLGKLYQVVKIDETVWIPGNHDLSGWRWWIEETSRSALADVTTDYTGLEVNGLSWPWKHLFPAAGRLRVAYPLFWDKDAGTDYPMLVFTHGHLLDPLVLGRDPEYEYEALASLGARKPVLSLDGGACSVRDVARKTDPFTAALWKRYSKLDYTYSNYIMRRLAHPQSCYFQNFDRSIFGLALANLAYDRPPPSQDYVSGQAPWFLDAIVADPDLPTPVGSLRPDVPSPALTRPSCLVHGHDHLGSWESYASAGVPFALVDSAGWTSEFDGHMPHAHVLVWDTMAQVVPRPYFLRARTSTGTIL